MPKVVEMGLAIPVELGPTSEVREALRQRVAAVEAECVAERQRTGKRVLGRRAVRQQAWWPRPTSVEPRRNLRPRVACAEQVGADRGAAAQPSIPVGVRGGSGRLAGRRAGGVPGRHVLAATVRERADRDVTIHSESAIGRGGPDRRFVFG